MMENIDFDFTGILIIVNSKFLKCYYKAKRRTPAYSRVLNCPEMSREDPRRVARETREWRRGAAKAGFVEDEIALKVEDSRRQWSFAHFVSMNLVLRYDVV